MAKSYIYISIYTILVIRHNEQLADDRFRDIRSSSCVQTNRCYAYVAEKSEEFMKWWRSTRLHFANEEKSRKAMKKIDWGSTKRKAAEWKEFQESATVGDGNPKIICSLCSLVLTHPSLGSGNICMTNHLNSESCKKTSKWKGMKQLSLKVGYRAKILLP